MEPYKLILSSYGVETAEPLTAASPYEAIAFARRALFMIVLEQEPPVPTTVAVFAGKGEDAEPLGVWHFDPVTGDVTWIAED